MENRCPVTGLPCPHPKVIHVTEVGANYEATGVFHLCQVCGNAMMEEDKPKPPPPPVQPQPALPPFVKGLFELLALVMHNKMKGFAAVPVQQQPPQMPQGLPQPQYIPTPIMKPPCPVCGTTLHDIAKTSRLGCGHCYEHYRTELLPVFINAHKAAEHVGKRPKQKHSLEGIPLEEQIKLVELQLKQAVEFEQYERAQVLKQKLDELRKQINPEAL
jgi:hypothetical protein